MRPSDEIERVREAYARRGERGADRRYALSDRANRYLFEQRERALLALLRDRRLLPLAGRRVLDAGCGDGGVLRDLVRYGAEPRLLAGIDLIRERIRSARERAPDIAFALGSAHELPYTSGSFDVVLQFTLLSSVLDDEMRRRIASETLRVLHPRGTVLWYDFIWNPLNRDVRGIRLGEVRSLYAGCHIDARRVTLPPPISRALARVSPALCRLLEAIPALRSHHLIAIEKPA